MDKKFSEAFERAKRLSDIVGMLTRMAFLVLLTTFVATSMEQYSGWQYAALLCTQLVLGVLVIRLGWLTADVFGKGWLAFLTRQLSDSIGKRSPAIIVAIVWAGRVVSFIVLFGLFGMSVSLISYGELLAKRLVQETATHTD
ncbi:hypothetical protein ABK249_23025 [Neorhizobium sp. Rsf11]|uniref:Uncharacterized protein n=1 Tax=Neorhizobium phenanthreniclasticum TaxID=3157917 RepID=A0ABV0M7D9_9HYPH